MRPSGHSMKMPVFWTAETIYSVFCFIRSTWHIGASPWILELKLSVLSHGESCLNRSLTNEKGQGSTWAGFADIRSPVLSACGKCVPTVHVRLPCCRPWVQVQILASSRFAQARTPPFVRRAGIPREEVISWKIRGKYVWRRIWHTPSPPPH